MNSKDCVLNCLCEYKIEPFDVQTEKPRFSWTAGCDDFEYQSSYRVIVSSSEKKACENKGDVWDSGTVVSDRSICVRYNGKPLESRTKYFWRVVLTDTEGRKTESGINGFATAIMDNSGWRGIWIEDPAHKHGITSQFRKTFTCNKNVLSAKIYISGPGYCYLYINGKRVGDSYLDPGFTNYEKTILYSVYDVSSLIQEGNNVIAAELGEGWYGHKHESFIKYMGQHPKWCSNPKLIFDLDILCDNGDSVMIQSDGTELCTHGGVRENGIFNGETFDAGYLKRDWKEISCLTDGNEWRKAVVSANPPRGRLISQIMPPIRATQEFEPVAEVSPEKDTEVNSDSSIRVYDFGQNFTGWVRISCSGPKGSTIVLKYAETASETGYANQGNLREARSTDKVILDGSGPIEYEPLFTYHGFRFVQAECWGGAVIHSIKGRVIHTDVDVTGRFSSSDETLNKIHRAMLWTERSNMHSIPTDCPQRDERMAWVNDMTVRCSEALFNFDLILFYEKWMRDIADEQDAVTGSIPDTAPHVYGGNPSYHISSSFIIIPWLLYLHYGDDTMILTYYDEMRRYFDFLVSQTRDWLIGSPYYGEWAPPEAECDTSKDWGALPINIPPEIVTTGYLNYDSIIMQKAAVLAGRPEDAKYYEDARQKTADAINNTFYDSEKGHYTPGSQGANIFPLFLGITEPGTKESVLNSLLEDLVNVKENHITTGNQMTKYLFEVLHNEGLDETALQVLSSDTYPSLGYMIANGATTIWERWEKLDDWGMNSHNHPMNGACTAWLFNGLGGLRLDREPDRLMTVIIELSADTRLDRADISYKTVKGELAWSWTRNANGKELSVKVPWNMRVKLRLGKGTDRKEILLETGSHKIDI